MIFLELFWTFFKIGLFTFGGGYAMIPLIRENVLANGWLTDSELLSFIAVSESTPGPVAVNMATFIGSSQGSIFGSFCATLGVVLPSFIIILIIAMVMKNFIKYPAVKATLGTIRPAVVALIVSASVTLGFSVIFNIGDIFDITDKIASFDWKSVVIIVLVAVISIVYSKLKKKKISPILLILFSGVMGVILY